MDTVSIIEKAYITHSMHPVPLTNFLWLGATTVLCRQTTVWLEMIQVRIPTKGCLCYAEVFLKEIIYHLKRYNGCHYYLFLSTLSAWLTSNAENVSLWSSFWNWSLSLRTGKSRHNMQIYISSVNAIYCIQTWHQWMDLFLYAWMQVLFIFFRASLTTVCVSNCW